MSSALHKSGRYCPGYTQRERICPSLDLDMDLLLAGYTMCVCQVKQEIRFLQCI